MKLYRPATVIVGILFVLLGGITRLAAPDEVFDKQNMIAVRGSIGEPVKYGDSTVTITRIKFAKAIVEENDEDKAYETDGIYVALEWDTVRGAKNPENVGVTMTADGGSVYTPIGGLTDSGIDFPDAGFAKTGAMIFEVNPTDLKGLKLILRPSMLWNVLNSYDEIDLGIPSEAVAQQLVDEAEQQYVLRDSVTRVASS
jgi:hypothetical protein